MYPELKAFQEMLVGTSNHSTDKGGEEHMSEFDLHPWLASKLGLWIWVGRTPSEYQMYPQIGVVFPSPWLSPSLAHSSLLDKLYWLFRARIKYHLLREACPELPGRMKYSHFCLTPCFLHACNKAWMRLYYNYPLKSFSLPSPLPLPLSLSPPLLNLDCELLQGRDHVLIFFVFPHLAQYMFPPPPQIYEIN